MIRKKLKHIEESMKTRMMICIALTMIIVGCKKVDVNFTYSPTTPKAGETISFTNNSSAGESWLWTFGDNTTSLAKSPNKIYKKPGEYVVTLMVDSTKYLTHSKVITIYDTIPTFVSSADSILHYQDVTFSANIYNPFNYTLTYEWVLPNNCEVVSGTRNSEAITVYFTSPCKDTVQLSITQKDKEYTIKKRVVVHLTKAPAIVIRKADNTVVRQRIIQDRIEQISLATSEDIYLVEQSSDTVVTFNGQTFSASLLPTTITGFAGLHIQRVQIDAMAQKWYITTSDGLFVANMNGGSMVQIDANATGAIYVDANRNRIYWATAEGLWAMPLIKSKNNQYTTTPVQYNNLNNIDLIIVNNKLQ